MTFLSGQEVYRLHVCLQVDEFFGKMISGIKIYVTGGTASPEFSVQYRLKYGYTLKGQPETPQTCYASQSITGAFAQLDIPLSHVTQVKLLSFYDGGKSNFSRKKEQSFLMESFT